VTRDLQNRESPVAERARTQRGYQRRDPMRVGRLDDEELHIRDVPTPESGSEEAWVRSTTAGMHHSDMHVARGHDLT
jgi:hypothetical protein